MALNTITPSNREEEYLSAIAGDEGASAPVPSNRREEWLRRIAEHGESIPSVPEAGDSNKVWTAGSDGTADWKKIPENPIKILYATGTATVSGEALLIPTNLTMDDIVFDDTTGRQITVLIVALPQITTPGTDYTYEDVTQFHLVRDITDQYTVGSYTFIIFPDSQTGAINFIAGLSE